jgi:hypothetical protein
MEVQRGLVRCGLVRWGLLRSELLDCALLGGRSGGLGGGHHGVGHDVAEALAALAGHEHHDQADQVQADPVEEPEQGPDSDSLDARLVSVLAGDLQPQQSLPERLPAARLEREVVEECPPDPHGRDSGRQPARELREQGHHRPDHGEVHGRRGHTPVVEHRTGNGPGMALRRARGRA